MSAIQTKRETVTIKADSQTAKLVPVCEGVTLIVTPCEGNKDRFLARTPDGEPLGNWCKGRTEFDQDSPTIEQINAAVSKDLGFKVEYRDWDGAGTVTLARVPLSDDEKQLQKIQHLSERARQLGAEHDDLKARTNAKKKEWEVACEAVITEGLKYGETPPLLAFAEKQAQGEDAWEAVPLREALQNLSSKLYEALEEAGLKTMGDLSAYQNDEHRKEIKGIGEAKWETIHAAEGDFWVRWNQEREGKS